MLFDLHLHSRYSVDALSKPETIVKVCQKNGWGFSLTDHNNMDAYKKTSHSNIRKLSHKAGVFLVSGQEIKVFAEPEKDSKTRTRLRGAGEVVAYFLNEEIMPAPFEEVLDEVKAQGALLSCPHPFDWPRKNFKAFPKEWKKFQLMETYNARAYYQGLNEHAKKFSKSASVKGKIACLGVSDAHTPEEIGNGLTEIDAVNESEFRKEIKRCRTIVVPRGKAKVWHHAQTQFARRRWMKER